MAKQAKKDDAAPKKRGRPPGTKNKAKEAAAKPAASSKSSAPAPKADSGYKKPAAEQVVRLVKRLESMHAEARGKTSEMGEVVAKAVENQHFDRTALGMARKLFKLAKNKPEAFATTFTHLLAYCDDLELDKIAADNRGMDLDGEDEDQDQIDIEEAIEEAAEEELEIAEPAPPAPTLQIVPGPSAPDESDFEVPPAPQDEAA